MGRFSTGVEGQRTPTRPATEALVALGGRPALVGAFPGTGEFGRSLAGRILVSFGQSCKNAADGDPIEESLGGTCRRQGRGVRSRLDATGCTVGGRLDAPVDDLKAAITSTVFAVDVAMLRCPMIPAGLETSRAKAACSHSPVIALTPETLAWSVRRIGPRRTTLSDPTERAAR
jgi:hypothetical protein